MTPKFSDDELTFMNDAAKFFDAPSLFVKGLNFLSTPIELARTQLPVVVQEQLTRASQAAVEKALILSIKTISPPAPHLDLSQAQEKSKTMGKLHSGLTGLVGGLGGFFGMAALPLEIPIATWVMLRSIAEIANQNGADLNSAEAKLDCLFILSLHGESPQEGVIKSDYYATRMAFAEVLAGASAFVTVNSTVDVVSALQNKTAPVLVRLIAEVASRFEIQLTRKFFAQITPMVGALGGASLNLMFANYYNNCARFHFGLRNLERKYGTEITQEQFEKFRISNKTVV